MQIRTSLCVCLLAMMLAIVPLPAQSQPDFSGTWKLDIVNSDLGGMNISELVSRIDHKDPAFKCVSEGVMDGKKFTESLDVTIGGKPTKASDGTTVTGRWDGVALVIEGKRPDGSVSMLLRYIIATDGRTVILDHTKKSAAGEVRSHEIYQKQQMF